MATALTASRDVNGATPYSNTALLAVKAVVTAGKTQLYGYNISNPNGSVAYVQVFDLLTADVTVGSTTPTYTLSVPPSGGLDGVFPLGIMHRYGLVIAATTTATGSTALGSALVVSLFYRG